MNLKLEFEIYVLVHAINKKFAWMANCYAKRLHLFAISPMILKSIPLRHNISKVNMCTYRYLLKPYIYGPIQHIVYIGLTNNQF